MFFKKDSDEVVQTKAGTKAEDNTCVKDDYACLGQVFFDLFGKRFFLNAGKMRSIGSGNDDLKIDKNGIPHKVIMVMLKERHVLVDLTDESAPKLVVDGPTSVIVKRGCEVYVIYKSSSSPFEIFGDLNLAFVADDLSVAFCAASKKEMFISKIVQTVQDMDLGFELKPNDEIYLPFGLLKENTQLLWIRLIFQKTEIKDETKRHFKDPPANLPMQDTMDIISSVPKDQQYASLIAAREVINASTDDYDDSRDHCRIFNLGELLQKVSALKVFEPEIEPLPQDRFNSTLDIKTRRSLYELVRKEIIQRKEQENCWFYDLVPADQQSFVHAAAGMAFDKKAQGRDWNSFIEDYSLNFLIKLELFMAIVREFGYRIADCVAPQENCAIILITQSGSFVAIGALQENGKRKIFYDTNPDRTEDMETFVKDENMDIRNKEVQVGKRLLTTVLNTSKILHLAVSVKQEDDSLEGVTSLFSFVSRNC